MRKVAIYNQRENNYAGWGGVDWYEIESSDGIIPYLGELNSRATANWPPLIVADKLQRRFGLVSCDWVNVNVWFNNGVRSIRDFEEMVTIGGYNYARGTPEQGIIIPLSARTMVGRDNTPVYLSNACKVLIFAQNHEACDRIIEELRRNGVSFESKPYEK